MNDYFYGTLTGRYCFSPESFTNKTWHLTIKVPDCLPFSPGDSVGIYPKAPRRYVEDLCEYFHVRFEEPYADDETKESTSVAELLLSRKDSVRVTTEVVQAVLHTLSSHTERKTLEEFVQKNRIADQFDVKTFLQRFAPEGVPLGPILSALRPQLPRLYSIASGPLKDSHEIELIVAQVVIRTDYIHRLGLCSGYLTDELFLMDPSIKMYLSPTKHFTFEDDGKKKIFIATGTGIAPFRSFMQEFSQRQERIEKPRFWLFFGGRKKEHDFFYEDFWTQQVNKSVLHVTTAFSQDQAEKQYVQHKLMENREHVWEWIKEGASIYICGNAKTMAKDVEACLKTIIEIGSGKTKNEVLEFMKQLYKTNRLRKDVY